MTTPSAPSATEQTGEQAKRPRDLDNWPQTPNKVFNVTTTPAGALNQVNGMEITGPLRGFGPLWQKTYWITFPSDVVSPSELIKAWKANFPKFWPKGNRFYAARFYLPMAGVKPGEVALINGDVPGGIKFSTGVMVIYSDEQQFTFITPEGHIFAGWITFSAYEKDGATVAQAEALVRSPDPLMEVILRFGLYREEDKFWFQTLVNVGRYFVVEARPQMRKVCADPRFRWSDLRYMRYNAAIRAMRLLVSPQGRKPRRRAAH